MNDGAWRKLIKQIREGQVVPLVGPQLLEGTTPGSSVQARLARRLLELYDPGADPELPPGRELHEAVSRLKPRVNVQDLYSDAHDAMVEFSSEPLEAAPEAIRQLAAITDFRLLVTLTPDDLLARCLRQRIAVNEIVHAPKWGTDDWLDLPADWAARRGEVQLLYLFGKASSLPTFALHDEDLLEFAHNVITGGSQVPRRFLDELRRKGLLLIGCNFPDWLGRFLLRVTNVERLSKKDTRTWIVEPAGADASLGLFLRTYATQTEVVADLAPREFVAELHRRWSAEQPAAAASTRGPAAVPDVRRGALFFVSYSRRTDRSRAETLVQALLGLGVAENEIWFDTQTIEPGQDFSERILDGIQSCRFFLPLLSEATNAREEAFVFSEWRAANRRRERMNREFLMPIVVDAEYEPERYTAPPVLEWAHDHIDFGHAPEGAPDGRTLKALQRLLRGGRRSGE